VSKTADAGIKPVRMMMFCRLGREPMSTDTNPRDEADAKIALYGIAVAVSIISAVLFLMYL
jgi:hypothetical protein